jgi:lipopolysaccharide transport system permease protein
MTQAPNGAAQVQGAESESAIRVIEAGNADRNYWKDVWRFRELFYFLAWRDVLVRYKQTVMGIAWAVARPFITMVVFTIVFGHLAKMPSGGAPYPIVIFAALLPWQMFGSAVTESGSSLLNNSPLISKIYFPRILIPLSAIAVSIVDFMAALVVMVGLVLWFGYLPPPQVVFIPVLLLLTALIAAGVGLLFAAVSVKYRDMRILTPFVVQFGLYISPIGFTSQVVPEKWQLLYMFNPMVGVIEGFRWALLGGDYAFPTTALCISVAMAVIFGFVGIHFFRKNEKSFADII